MSSSLSDDHQVGDVFAQLLHSPPVLLAGRVSLVQFIEKISNAREGGATVGVKERGSRDYVAVLDPVRQPLVQQQGPLEASHLVIHHPQLGGLQE